jgi:hypothetical protein
MAGNDRKSLEQQAARKPGERPADVKPPAYLSKSPPVPEPDPLDKADEILEKDGPTRYGDWEHKGLAIDF